MVQLDAVQVVPSPLVDEVNGDALSLFDRDPAAAGAESVRLVFPNGFNELLTDFFS
jgi:hypothetical protein